MITEKEAQELLSSGKVKQYKNHYYFFDVEDENDFIKMNKVRFASGEWVEFYYDIKHIIERGTGENKIVPLITYEMCVSCGL